MHRPFSQRLALGLAVAAAATLSLSPRSLAAEITDVGYVDQAALANVGSFQAANRSLAQYQAGLNVQFQREIKGVRSADAQAKIAEGFKEKLAARQREVLGPLFARAQAAIASVAASKNLSVVVDKHIIVYGGQDVTRGVIDVLDGAGAPAAPSASPPPSSVGYVDQSAVDDVPKLKSANDQFNAFQVDESKRLQAQMRSAKTDDDRRKLLADAQKAVDDKKAQLIDPLVDQTRSVIADVAKKHDLLLVIDRSNLVYGGTDITADVTSALK